MANKNVNDTQVIKCPFCFGEGEIIVGELFAHELNF